MAITLERPAYYDAERVNDWVALSTDVLPTSTTPGFKLYQGDRVYLMDTGKRKVYDATADTWYEQPAIGGLGILNKNGEVINATLATVQSVATQYMVTNYGRQPKTGDALIITLTDQSNDKVLYIYSEVSQVWVNTGINVDLTQYYTKSQVNGIVANEYSSSATYEVGDYCINGGVFYKCTTAIPVAEAWDATHWTATKAGSELTALSQGIVGLGTSKADKPVSETYTIATADWSALASSSPFTYSATVTAVHTIGQNTVVELLNDNAVLFATYGFAIGAVSGQSITVYSIGQPSASVTLGVDFYG